MRLRTDGTLSCDVSVSKTEVRGPETASAAGRVGGSLARGSTTAVCRFCCGGKDGRLTVSACTAVRGGKAGTQAPAWTEAQHGAPAPAGGTGSEPGMVGGLHD
jgi:hypothetical protein